VVTLALAGVLLGKTSFNSLYGGLDGPSQVSDRGASDSGRIAGIAAVRMNKI
jgi:hypothetical protein